jgi:type IVB pilus formation R64 PilN family outer membrane protein
MQRQRFLTRTSAQSAALTACAVFGATALTGCSTVKEDIETLKNSTNQRIAQVTDNQPVSRPVVTRTAAAWIMGDVVAVKPPEPKFLSRKVTYIPPQLVTLTDVASYLSQQLQITIDTSEVMNGVVGTAVSSGMGAMPGSSAPVVPGLSGMPMAQPMGGGMANTAAMAQGVNLAFAIDYQGPVSGLLDIVASKIGVWWKPSGENRAVFYRTETQTFYLPALPNSSKGGSAISSNASTSASGGGGGGTQAAGGIAAAGNANTGTEYNVDVWVDLEKTAQTVAGTAKTAVNRSAGSVTVTGTPTQVRNVEQWVKSLSDNMSQQVSITLDIFTVNVKAEDSYSWNPAMVFNSLSGKYGFTLSGPDAPSISSGVNPMSLSASILSSATGKLGQYSGSEFALQALSSLGDVASVMHKTVVTLNGQPAPIQMADIEGYLASSTPSASVAVGATPLPPTLTPGTLTTGFTATFIPKIVNGKIFMSMDMTNSTNNGFGKQGTTTSFIQTPNYSQNTFQQSFRLTPGDSLLLTSTQQLSGKSNRNGVGSPNNFVLGGGVADSTNKLLTAIVVSAKVL